MLTSLVSALNKQLLGTFIRAQLALTVSRLAPYIGIFYVLLIFLGILFIFHYVVSKCMRP